MALMLDSLAHGHPHDPLSMPPPRVPFVRAVEEPKAPKRVAFTPDLNLSMVDPEVAAICRKGANSFTNVGARVEETCPDFSGGLEAFQTLRAILVAAVWGPSLRNVILIITIWTWSGYARLVRADVLSLREREFVLAARAIGAHDGRVLLRHVLPNLLNIVVILMTMEVATVILFEAGLSFLNVGVDMGTPSWGAEAGQRR